MVVDKRPILVLGAGINGAAVARELALRGAAVVLVDAADLASGATAYSSRLIHGGLRYLEYGEVDLVRESLAERGRLLRLAPQFVRPLRLFIPVSNRTGGFGRAAATVLGFSHRLRTSAVGRGLWVVRMGLWLYDRFASDSQLPRHATHRVCDPQTPPVDRAAYRWMCSYSDAQITYPERFVVALLEDARQLARDRNVSCDIFTYHRATLRDGVVRVYRAVREGGEALETEPRDALLEFTPAAIVNATGAWVDQTLARLDVSSRRLIGGTKGSHFLTFHPRLREALTSGGIYAEAGDGRPVFLLPWGDGTLVGTTDLPFDDCPDRAVATEDELQYLLAAVQRVFPSIGLTRGDIHIHYSGVRPLPFTDAQAPAAVSRRHWLEEHAGSQPPLYSIIGGKLTTCRSLAEHTAHTVLTKLGWPRDGDSRDRVLPGGEDWPADEASLAAEQRRLAQSLRLSLGQVQAVWKLWGSRTKSLADEVVKTHAGREESLQLSGSPLPFCFLRRVIRDEWVTRLNDLVERRLMLHFQRDLNQACLRQLAQLLVEAGKLNPQNADAEVAGCVRRLEVHYGWTPRD